jgi:hypothetical protein
LKVPPDWIEKYFCDKCIASDNSLALVYKEEFKDKMHKKSHERSVERKDKDEKRKSVTPKPSTKVKEEVDQEPMEISTPKGWFAFAKHKYRKLYCIVLLYRRRFRGTS